MTTNASDTIVGWSLAAGACLLLAAPLAAVEGVIQINQARALAGGVTAGDSPGFPVTLDVPGSYVLTSDLVLPDRWTTAIEIEGDAVSLDLNGFAIRGPVACTGLTGSSLVCTPSDGDGDGIEISGYATTVRNGTISGMRNGIMVPGTFADQLSAITVSDVTVYSNWRNGMALGQESMVTRSVVTANGLNGIEVGELSSISECVTARNGSVGVALNGGVVSGCIARRNGFAGIRATGLVQECEVSGNSTYGIWLNGQGLHNRIVSNAGLGIQEDGLCTYGMNTLAANNAGGDQVASACVEIATNYCNGNTTCP